MNSTLGKWTLMLTLVGALTACGQNHDGGAGTVSIPNLPPVGGVSADGVVVQSRAIVSVQTSSAGLARILLNKIFPLAFAAGVQQPVTVVNSPSSTIALDASAFLVPAISNSMIDFGSLSVGALFDNNLDVCGANGKQKCGTALIRIYTSGAGGAGVWNTVDAYGAPITAGMLGAASGTVGLNVDGAYVLESVSLATSKHVVNKVDFIVAPKIGVKADFTNAGAGSYSTNLVVEYGLSL